MKAQINEAIQAYSSYMEMGQWVIGHRAPFLDGPHGSSVTASDQLTHVDP